ncbi:hypothetical protein BJY00DRAFT_295514 [Aspergillus carlsbadensis]|nr:hypothetical protein BJY00DRAFT_295514 [Aspergillus carlsbadensis]
MSSVGHADDDTEPLFALPNIGLDSAPSANQSVAEQIRDIIQALKEIRSQLADQNKYLDVLADKYIKPAAPPQPRIVYIDDEEWIDTLQPVQEEWHRSLIPDRERMDFLKERFIEGLRDPEGLDALLDISVPPSADGAQDSTSRGSLETLAAAWPVYQEPPPDIGLRTMFESKDAWADFDTFFASCLRAQRESDHGPVYSHGLDPHRVGMHEFGYDSEASTVTGSYSALQSDSLIVKREYREMPPPSLGRPWSGRVCGRIIIVYLGGVRSIPVGTVAFVLWQLDSFGAQHRSRYGMHPGQLCLSGFMSSWMRQHPPSRFVFHDVRMLCVSFQVRWMRFSSSGPTDSRVSYGIFFERDKGDIPNAQGSVRRDLNICEDRQGFAMITTVDRPLPLYTIINLTGDVPFESKDTPSNRLDRIIQNRPARSYLTDNLTGLGMFLIFVSGNLALLAGEWTRLLDILDETLHTSLAQMTREKRQALMFDGDFSKSDQYFAVLQTLHMCTDWITGTLRDLKELCQRLESVVEHPPGITRVDKEALVTLCEAVIADSELHFHPLLDRIERKVEEVKSLRDGLFNATSVKEASKGIRLAENSRRQNRYVLVFTVATVFYLPMGFVTSFFGMHLFDPNNDDPSSSQIPFLITFVVLSIATYVIATGALFAVREDQWVKTTIASWKLVAASFGIGSQNAGDSGFFDRLNRKKAVKETAV